MTVTLIDRWVGGQKVVVLATLYIVHVHSFAVTQHDRKRVVVVCSIRFFQLHKVFGIAFLIRLGARWTANRTGNRKRFRVRWRQNGRTKNRSTGHGATNEERRRCGRKRGNRPKWRVRIELSEFGDFGNRWTSQKRQSGQWTSASQHFYTENR